MEIEPVDADEVGLPTADEGLQTLTDEAGLLSSSPLDQAALPATFPNCVDKSVKPICESCHSSAWASETNSIDGSLLSYEQIQPAPLADGALMGSVAPLRTQLSEHKANFARQHAIMRPYRMSRAARGAKPDALPLNGLLPVSRTPGLGVMVKSEVFHAASRVRA